MKKYNLILGITAVLSAAILSACENKGTRTMVYTEPIPYLTTVTQVTTIPADTYSEYMATYTTTVTGTPNYFAVPVLEGVAADTAMGNFPEPAVTHAPITDTAVTFPETEPLPQTETVSVTEEYSGTEISSETGSSSGSSLTESFTASPDFSADFPNLPAADTVSPHRAQTDTAPTMYTEESTDSETDTNTSNGGKNNADQHTQ